MPLNLKQTALWKHNPLRNHLGSTGGEGLINQACVFFSTVLQSIVVELFCSYL